MSALTEMLKRVDWIRVVHVGTSLARELRSDGPVIDEDSQRMRAGAQRMLAVVTQAGRAALGCVKPKACACAFCAEEKEGTK